MPTQSILNSAFFYRGKTNCGCGTHTQSPSFFKTRVIINTLQ
uniref:Uncharacterized protein n=1 Tax=Anguilla anguilla TaxID=7936 RepID=A0A0E9QSK9_ANGAN